MGYLLSESNTNLSLKNLDSEWATAISFSTTYPGSIRSFIAQHPLSLDVGEPFSIIDLFVAGIIPLILMLGMLISYTLWLHQGGEIPTRDLQIF